MFYDVFISLCKLKGVKPSRAADDCKINRSNVVSWRKNGYTPRGDALSRIADYFGVTTNYLLGIENFDSEKKKALVNEDEDLTIYLQELKDRPEMKMLFDTARNATKEDIEQAVKIIEALKK